MMRLVSATRQGGDGIRATFAGGDLRGFVRKYSDIGLAGLVVLIVGMMIVPLPTLVLDVLIALNIAIGVTLLLIAIYVSDAIRIATFPTVLLLTTLFRLALEVSATRLILLKGDAGEVIHAFGNFVVAGNLVVGAVIFFILTMIQFIVISKGSERVAEVGARFTLDAMPGKQMSIDADLRAGHIDQGEARRRRSALQRESQFFGAMDGAMKFVKGDAIAGIIILLTNIIGGLIIGIVQRGMDAGAAARTYTVLTIGEGLVSQIPALVVSTAAGLVVTRVSAEEEGAHLGREIGAQVLGQPKALAVAAALLALLAIVPGLPALPFLSLAVVLAFVAYRLLAPSSTPPVAAGDGRTQAAGPGAGRPVERADERREAPAPILVPIGVDLSPALSAALLPGGDAGRFTRELIPALRDRLFQELGLPLPAVRLRPNAPGLGARGYALRLAEVTMARGEASPGGAWTMATARLAELGLASTPGAHPDGTAGLWLAPESVASARTAGVPVLTVDEVIMAHLLVVLRRHGHELLGIQETQLLLEGLERSHPALVREVVPKLVSTVLLTDVLKRLAEEGVSVRGLREILGALAQWAPHERDPVALTEHVRQALRRQVTARYAGPTGSLAVYLLDPMIEETIRESIHKTPTGSYLALEPALSRDILQAIGKTVGRSAKHPALLTTADIRRYVRRLVETELPHLAVLSYQELAPEAALQPLGRVKLSP
jgi:type III secretion protein V